MRLFFGGRVGGWMDGFLGGWRVDAAAQQQQAAGLLTYQRRCWYKGLVCERGGRADGGLACEQLCQCYSAAGPAVLPALRTQRPALLHQGRVQAAMYVYGHCQRQGPLNTYSHTHTHKLRYMHTHKPTHTCAHTHTSLLSPHPHH